jgi:hypothetical protein
MLERFAEWQVGSRVRALEIFLNEKQLEDSNCEL